MSTPKVCLIGVGLFGKAHFDEWTALQEMGRVEVVALVVRTDESRDKLKAETGLEVYTSVDEKLLKQVDVVDIVTPASTHLEMLKMCLPHCHVLVEKPMVTSLTELDELNALLVRYPNRLMVGHNYRFNPVVNKLKDITGEFNENPLHVEITMLNKGNCPKGLNPNLEYVHAFDIINYLFDAQPTVEFSRDLGDSYQISIRYDESLHCVMKLGWHDSPTKRAINLVYRNSKIQCDLLRNTIRVDNKSGYNTYALPQEKVALRNELCAFLDFAFANAENPVPPDCVASALTTAIRNTPVRRKKKPRVAVVGGGVFGTNCALELNHFSETSLFERHDELLEEVSFVNQWRHHSGFHYPRSYDTIQEIRSCKSDFEEYYLDAVTRDKISYFCPSATGVEIPAERYIAACSSNNLYFTFEFPPADILDRDSVSISLKTDEGVYDFYKLRKIIEDRLAAADNTRVFKGTSVVDAKLLSDGKKELKISRNGHTEIEVFDYLINATYSNRNLLSKWFSFPIEPLRFDLYEMLVIRLPIKQLCVTIIDGPFTSLVGMGKDNLFLLSHIHDSVLQSQITEDGLPPDWGEIQSNGHNMLLSASKYIPILKEAEIVESRFATRAVNAYAHDFDARPSVISNPGFGCWSVLGGKILTCVTNAREIATAIEKAYKHE